MLFGYIEAKNGTMMSRKKNSIDYYKKSYLLGVKRISLKVSILLEIIDN